MEERRRARKGTLAAASLGLAALLGAVLDPAAGADVPAAQTPPVVVRTAAAVTADALPTAQIDGVVYSQVVVGTKVFAGGSFARARPAGSEPGQDEVVRTNLLSYDLVTGALLPFAPEVNGRVKTLSLSADGKTLYAGGLFTMVGTKERSRFAAFRVSDGRLESLSPAFNSSVNALVVSGKTVYAGGDFSTVAGHPRARLAAVSTTKKKLTAWAPAADATVHSLVVTPDRSSVVVGGSFTKLNKSKAPGMGRVSAKDGRTKSWKINAVVKDYGLKSGVLSLSADKTTVYGSTFAAGGGNFEGVFAANPKDGSIRWLQDCHGDTYSVVPYGDLVYSVGHAHFCSNIGGWPETKPQTNKRALAVTKAAKGTVAVNTQLGAHYGNFVARPAPSLLNWFPDLGVGAYTGQSQAAWSVAAARGYVVLGGEFVSVNGQKQQGLVRFAVPSKTAPAQGPLPKEVPGTPVVSITGDDSVSLTSVAYDDRDDLTLRYELQRDGVTVGSTTTSLAFWQGLSVVLADAGLEVGRTYRYQVRVSDPDGNSTTSPEVTVRLPASSGATPAPPPPAGPTPSGG